MEGTALLFGGMVYPLLAAVIAYGGRKRSWRTQHILALILSGTALLSSVLPLLLLARKLLTRTCSIRKQFQTVAILV